MIPNHIAFDVFGLLTLAVACVSRTPRKAGIHSNDYKNCVCFVCAGFWQLLSVLLQDNFRAASTARNLYTAWDSLFWHTTRNSIPLDGVGHLALVLAHVPHTLYKAGIGIPRSTSLLFCVWIGHSSFS